MDPQNSSPDCILGHDLKVLSRQSFNSMLQFSIAACSIFSRHAFVSSTCLFRRDKVSSVATNLSLAL